MTILTVIVCGMLVACSSDDNEDTKDFQKEHKFVDLGLPSGTLWACCNIGANSPEEYGDYFAWGEIKGNRSGKTDFSWGTYKWAKGSKDTLIKYNTKSKFGSVDNKTELDLKDDAAYANWGSKWRIPSIEQFEELYNSKYTTTEWTTLNGIRGRYIISKKNNNYIFLPAGGILSDYSLENELIHKEGHYWSRSLDSDYPCEAWSSAIYVHEADLITLSYRYKGFNIRPVYVP